MPAREVEPGIAPKEDSSSSDHVVAPSGDAQAAAGAAAVQRMIVSTERTGLNLRSAPGMENNVVGSLQRGSVVEAHGDAQKGYIAVTDPAMGRRGWSALRYLRPEHAAFATPPLARSSRPGATSPSQVPALPKDSHTPETISGSLFVKMHGDLDDISPNDVEQGELGDCYFLAALAAMARVNPELIRRMIKQLGPHLYEVTLYKKDHFWSARDPHKIVVDDRFPTNGKGKTIYAGAPESGPQGSELWVMLVEKAFATMEGSYQAIEGHWLDARAFDALLPSGGKTYSTRDYDAAQLRAMIDEALRARRPVTTATGTIDTSGNTLLDRLKTEHPSLPDWFVSKERLREEAAIKKTGAINAHEYAVSWIDQQANKIVLQNPWGYGHLILSFEDYKSVFSMFTIASAE